MDLRRFLEAIPDVDQDFAASIDAAAAEGKLTGPVPTDILRAVMDALEEEWRLA